MASFTITLEKTTSDPKQAVKSIVPESAVTKDCTPYETLDDLNGYVILDYDSTLMDKNYAQYDGKFYFVTDRTRDIGHKMKIFLRIDSLSTYWNQIKECDAVVNTTTNPSDPLNTSGWTANVQGNRLVYCWSVNHASQVDQSQIIDFSPNQFYMGIYG